MNLTTISSGLATADTADVIGGIHRQTKGLTRKKLYAGSSHGLIWW